MAGQTGKGGGRGGVVWGRMSPVKVSPATCHLSVQCSAALQYNADQPCSRLINLKKKKLEGEKTHKKIIKTENNRIVSPQAKVNDMPLTRFLFISKSGCFAMAHINTQTHKKPKNHRQMDMARTRRPSLWNNWTKDFEFCYNFWFEVLLHKKILRIRVLSQF